MLNGSKSVSFALAQEGSARFGKDHINISIENVDFVFKHREEMQEYQKALHNTEVFFDMDRIGERDNRTQSEVEQKNQPAK